MKGNETNIGAAKLFVAPIPLFRGERFCHGRHDPRLKLMRKPNYYMTLPRYATLCTAKNRSDSERRKLLSMYQRPLVTPTADGAAKSLTRSTMKWRNDSSWIPGKLT